MSPSHESTSPFEPSPTDDSVGSRILRSARMHLFRFGYASFTMDDLAGELGMSKKTLYQHFPGKEAIVEKIVDCIGASMTARLEAIVADPKLTFVQKLCRFGDVVGGTLSKVSPHLLRDLQRFAPGAYQHIDRLRQRNIPLFFSRLIRDGIAEGVVRREINPDFAAQFWLQAMRGLLQPDVLDRTQLTPKQTLDHAIALFSGGLLTPVGRKDYEKHIADCRRHDPSS